MHQQLQTTSTSRPAAWLPSVTAWALSILVAGAQGIPLLWRRSFAPDWLNHAWLINYYSDHFRNTFRFPHSIDTIQAIGNPLPLFYGIFFYPLLALPATFLGADLSIRLTCFVLLLAPLMSSSLVLFHYLRTMTAAPLIAATLTTSIYQMTNLYSRSALTEFMAHQLFLTAIPLIVVGMSEPGRRARAALGCGLSCSTMAFGAHPITLYLSALFVAPACVLFPLLVKRVANTQAALVFVAKGIMYGAPLLPWALLTMHYRSELHLNVDGPLSQKLYYFPDSIDSIWAKMNLSADPRAILEGLGSASTPFLDAPWPLAGLMAYCAIIAVGWHRASRYCAILLGFSAFMILTLGFFSIAPSKTFSSQGLWPNSVYVSVGRNFFYDFLIPIQFAYRLSNTFAALLCILVLIAAASVARAPSPAATRRLNSWSWTLAVIAAVFVFQKLYTVTLEYRIFPSYVNAFNNQAGVTSPNSFIFLTKEEYRKVITDTAHYPTQFYSLNELVMDRRYPPTPSSLPMDVASAVLTSIDDRVEAHCERACVIKTNVMPTAFLAVLMDGAAQKETFVGADHRVWIKADAGVHLITVERSHLSISRLMEISSAVAILQVAISVLLLAFSFTGLPRAN